MLLENPPLAYLITFTCYGTRLHGRDGGSVDRWHNVPGTPALEANPRRAAFEAAAMRHPAYHLDGRQPWIVLTAIERVCWRKRWGLLAAHVRTEHGHAVVEAPVDPDTVATALKAEATRALNDASDRPPFPHRWTERASTRYLWRHDAVEAAVDYVLHRQGEPMAVYPCEPPDL